MMTAKPIEIERGNPVRYAVIWLHGLGADGNDFVPVIRALSLAEETGVRFILPHAPVMPVTINQGMRMRAWYDIRSLDISDNPDLSGIDISVKTVNSMIETQVSLGISRNRIVLAGFSQGGAIALQAGLSKSSPVAGIIALSTYLPLPESIPPASENAPKILILHGRSDPVIPIHHAQSAMDRLTQLKYPVQYYDFQMAHEVCQEEVRRISMWLNTLLHNPDQT